MLDNFNLINIKSYTSNINYTKKLEDIQDNTTNSFGMKFSSISTNQNHVFDGVVKRNNQDMSIFYFDYYRSLGSYEMEALESFPGHSVFYPNKFAVTTKYVNNDGLYHYICDIWKTDDEKFNHKCIPYSTVVIESDLEDELVYFETVVCKNGENIFVIYLTIDDILHIKQVHGFKSTKFINFDSEDQLTNISIKNFFRRGDQVCLHGSCAEYNNFIITFYPNSYGSNLEIIRVDDIIKNISPLTVHNGFYTNTTPFMSVDSKNLYFLDSSFKIKRTEQYNKFQTTKFIPNITEKTKVYFDDKEENFFVVNETSVHMIKRIFYKDIPDTNILDTVKNIDTININKDKILFYLGYSSSYSISSDCDVLIDRENIEMRFNYSNGVGSKIDFNIPIKLYEPTDLFSSSGNAYLAVSKNIRPFQFKYSFIKAFNKNITKTDIDDRITSNTQNIKGTRLFCSEIDYGDNFIALINFNDTTKKPLFEMNGLKTLYINNSKIT